MRALFKACTSVGAENLDAFALATGPLRRAFRDPRENKIELAAKALKLGTVDRLLLWLGELQVEQPRRMARTKRFVKEVAGTTTEQQNAATPPAATTPAVGASAESAKHMWKPGYGTGDSAAHVTKMEMERETKRVEKIKRTIAAVECLSSIIESLPCEDDTLKDDDRALLASTWVELLDALDASCLLRVLMSNFFGVTSKAVMDDANLYMTLMGLCITICDKKPLGALVVESQGLFKSMHALLKGMLEIAMDLKEEEGDVGLKIYTLTENAVLAADGVAKRFEESTAAATFPTPPEKMPASMENIELLNKAYEEVMRSELFKDCDMRDSSTGLYTSSFLQAAVDEDAKENGESKTRQRRLNRELKALRGSLPLHFGSTVCLRIDRTRPFVGQFIVFAPSNTPYDSGSFLFDVFFSADYPNDPPKVNLQTTGQGRVRFNPNLYQNGKVCLSLLGTWRGGATGTENWNAERSSLYQVLVSIQSAILGSEFPYFNEPSMEASWGTEEGELQKRIHPNGGYERLRVATVQYAITAQIKSPPAGFEECIRLHFLHKRNHIMDVCGQWIAEAEKSDTRGHATLLKGVVEDLRETLNGLGVLSVPGSVIVDKSKEEEDVAGDLPPPLADIFFTRSD